MRAAIYSRKSTEDRLQASVTRQVAHAREFAERKGWVVADEHVYVDDGISGAEFHRRPGLRRMLDAAVSKPRPFDAVVMADAERLGRDRLRSEAAARDLTDAGVRIFFYLGDQEQRLDTPEDGLLFSLRSFGGEVQRARARLQTRDALKRKAQFGHVTGGVCYGYRNVPVHAGADSSGNPLRDHVRREIEPRQATVVRSIFQAFADGHGLRSIARALNADPSLFELSERYFGGGRVPAPRKGIDAWGPSTVRAILRRETYRGVQVWGRYRNVDKGGRTRLRSAQPPAEWIRTSTPELQIVSDELWNLADRRRRPAGSRAAAHGYLSSSLLSGFAICGFCGSPIVIAGSRKGQRTYGCSRFRNCGRSVCGNDLLESVACVDRRILEDIERAVLTPTARRIVLDAAEKQLLRQLDADEGTLGELKRALERVGREITNLVDAVQAGEAPSALVERLHDRERERATLRAQLNSHKTTRPLDALGIRRVRRLMESGLDRIADVLASDHVAARRALGTILNGKVRFTPIELAPSTRTYRFEASLALGRIAGPIAQSGGNVPDGI